MFLQALKFPVDLSYKEAVEASEMGHQIKGFATMLTH